ncbi:MAG TPA: M48 family metalloprotease [Caulobacteraceae bacterium]|jgi:Zn-dependent protease with chaperone function
MAALDISAATNAWLARLPEAQRLAAQAATDARLAGFVAGAVVFVAAAAMVARTGVIDTLTRRIEARGARPWLASAAAAGLLALVLAVAMALVNAWSAWRVGSALAAGGAPAADTGFGAHLAPALAGVAPTVTAAVIGVPLLGWLMRRLPRLWPLAAGATAVASILALFWLPYALSAGPGGGPAPPGPARDAVAQLIAQTRLPATGVSFNPDPGFDVDVTGGFGRAKVTIGPALTAMPVAEARAITGHLMGHYIHHDVLNACLSGAAVIVIGLFAAQRWGAPLARALGARGVTDPSAPAALPALAIIGGVTLTLAWLAVAAYFRWANVGADAYALDQARAPDGLAAVIEREWDHNAVAPSPLETVLFYSHPPLSDRIAHAMAWKAAHGG